MPAEDFIDTNVFVYQLERADERKAAIAADLIEKGIASGSACISYQVVQECMNVALHKARRKLIQADMHHYLDTVLRPLLRVKSSLTLYRSALDVQTRYRFRFYDSLIIASANKAGCRRLYTEDLQHGQRIEQLTIINPFRD